MYDFSEALMQQTWRWFGPHTDPVHVQHMLQAGVEAVVTALYDVPNGEVWTEPAIRARQAALQQRTDGGEGGLAWSVVESLPVSDAIKRKDADFSRHVANYRSSLENLHACGIDTVCYNLMPVLDWTRTALRKRLPHGGTTMAFDLVDFAVFDIHLLSRDGAADDYDEATVVAADTRLATQSDTDRQALINNVVAGLPGANDQLSLGEVRDMLATWQRIDAATLQANATDFLAEVVPTAERLGMRLCCHPDDPPFALLGLPRILSSEADYRWLVDAVPSPANGITFCTGSLGVNPGFDPVGFVNRLGSHIHFVHLRTTRRDGPAGGDKVSFFEDEHLAGDTDLVATVRALLAEESRRRAAGRTDHTIPFRPDHGHDLLDDLERDGMPGYPLIGRLRGLAELRGVMAAYTHAGD
ncbi:MAG: mannonate dehydratase [Pseudomonadota bacterium]